MAGLNASLEIAKNALLNTQVQIQVTSHNIANAQNPNYTRQKTHTVTQGATRERAGWIGAGARLARIVQQRDQFIEANLLQTLSGSSYHETLGRVLEAAETYLYDDGDGGLTAALEDFWDAWNALSQNPGGAEEEALVAETGRNLARMINESASNLNEIQDGIHEDMQDQVQEVNALLERIRELNAQIAKSETPEAMANDLRDQRYEALKELSKYVRFRTEEISGGVLNVFLEDGTPLVLSKESASEFSVDPGGTLTITIRNGGMTPKTFDLSSTEEDIERLGGSIGGLLRSAQKVASWQNNLDDLAVQLTEKSNEASGVTLFSYDTADSTRAAESLRYEDPDLSAANALAMLDLQSESIDGLDGLTFGEFLSQLSEDIGLTVQSAQDQSAFHQTLAGELESQRQSISGVSIDEEMVELLKHQQLYQAAAKVVQYSAQMIQTAIDMVR